MAMAANCTTSSTANLSALCIENSSDVNGTTFFNFFIHPDFFTAYNYYLYLMVALGVSGNLIVLVVFIRYSPTTTTDWFILFITVCDFTSSLINVPVYVTFTNGYWRYYGTTLICRLHMFISQSIVLSSSFLICGLALDRYFKICRPLPYFTKSRARNVCIAISITTTLLSAPCFMMYENRDGRCVSIVMDNQLFSYYLMVLLIFIIAAVAVVFSYFKVAKAVRKSEMNMLRHTELTGTFKLCCCFLPTFRQNKVGTASLSIAYRSGLFKDTANRTSETETSGISDSLQVPRRQYLSVPKGTSERSAHAHPLPSVSSGIAEQVQDNVSIHVHRPVSAVAQVKQLQESKLVSLRTTRIAFLVCSIFILTWIPPWVCFIIATIPGMRTDIKVVKFMIFGRMTYLINGITNPILYTGLNKQFRKNFLEILSCRQS